MRNIYLLKSVLLVMLLCETGFSRFIDPSESFQSEMSMTRESEESSDDSESRQSRWGRLKGWVAEKAQAVRAEAERRGLLNPPTPESVAEKAQRTQESAGVTPVTPKVDVIAESFSPQEVEEATRKMKESSVLSEKRGRNSSLENLVPSEAGVPVWSRQDTDAAGGVRYPRLDVGEEPRLSRHDFSVPSFNMKKIVEDLSLKLPSEDVFTEDDERFISGIQRDVNLEVREFKVEMLTNKEIEELSERVASLRPDVRTEADLVLQEFSEFTQDDVDLLSALILIKNNDQCSAALSLLHRLSQKTGYKDEANFYLTGCQKELGLLSESMASAVEVLKSQNPKFVAEVVDIVGYEIPYEHLEIYAQQLLRVVTNVDLKVLDEPRRSANVGLILAEYGLATDRYKIAYDWSKRVPSAHPEYHHAMYMQAVAEYALGQEKNGMETQAKLLELLEQSSDKDVRTLSAANLGRLQFQNGLFQSAQKSLAEVDKNHPLWIQSLLEMGWSQIQYGDYAGAIGNMYSIHSPFFQYVYKPESYVVRTIGYLKLCQYADAYRTLTTLESEYRPMLAQMENYIKSHAQAKTYYQTVRRYIRSNQGSEVDALSPQIVREMARHRDFLNLQNALNRNVDERKKASELGGIIGRNISRSQHLIRSTKERIDRLNQEIASVGTASQDTSRTEPQMRAELQTELGRLASYEYILEIHRRTQSLLPNYVTAATKRADRVVASTRSKIESTLAKRLHKMRDNLVRILDGNEFLRYEVFSGSGENIRFEMAGGQRAERRVPASVMPKSKELRWSFDGEYWADEIGHYRSSLKSNCPQSVSMGR